MSLPLGYPPSVSTSIPSTTLLMSTPPTTTAASGAASPCCENGRPVMTDPHTGQTICSCQYPAGLLAAAYSRVPGLAEGVYPSPYAAQQGLMTLGATDPSAFYAPIGLSGSAPCYTYDPTMGAYGYSNGFMDPNARRKNATRESTNTLKAWLSEHRKNPYPTKGEKIMLAIITKMTLTQVSTWFANARRRLKKENKMTWSPRNRCDEDGDDEDGNSDDEHNEHNKKDHDDDDVLDDSEFINVDCDKEDDDAAQEEAERAKRDRISSTSESEDVSRPEVQSATSCKSPPSGSCHNGCHSPHGSNCSSPNTTSPGLPPRIPLHPGHPIRPLGLPATTATALNYSHLKNNANVGTSASSSLSSPSQTSSATNRPKIWSIADVATSSDNHSDRKSPTVTSGPPNAQQLQPSHAGPIRPQHIGAHSGLPAGFGRSWAAAAVAANGLSHPYSFAPHFLGLHRDPTSSVGSFISGPNTSTILSRFGFPPMTVSTSSLADPKRLPGGAPVAAPANR